MIMYTNSDPQCVTSVPRRQTNGSRKEVSCPLAITSYNKNMAAVDKGDQSRGYYHCRIKSRKFYKYIYYFLLVRPSRMPSSFTGDGQEPLKFLSSSSGSSWPRSLLGDIVAFIELGIMAP